MKALPIYIILDEFYRNQTLLGSEKWLIDIDILSYVQMCIMTRFFQLSL